MCYLHAVHCHLGQVWPRLTSALPLLSSLPGMVLVLPKALKSKLAVQEMMCVLQVPAHRILFVPESAAFTVSTAIIPEGNDCGGYNIPRLNQYVPFVTIIVIALC